MRHIFAPSSEWRLLTFSVRDVYFIATSACILHYTMVLYFFFLFFPLDTGFHCHPIRVHVRVGIWGLVYMVEAGGVGTTIIVPSSPDACSAGVDDRDSTNKGRVSGL